ncbi:MAG: L-2-amino-thiazoline-4-carboxylic acid hydrolase [Thermodesulfobacteriota bacterium]
MEERASRRRRTLARALAPALRLAARRALIGRARCRTAPERGRFPRGDVDELLRATWRTFAELSPSLPLEPTLGARMNVALACLTLSFHRALSACGVERAYATELAGDAAWVVYRRWGDAARLVSQLRTADPHRRLRIATGLFRRFPFGPPGYVMRDVASPDAVAFDVLRCPIAEYFRAHDATDVCVGTWCNLDFALAESWGGRLVREGTLAGGATRCDFRWQPVPAASSATAPAQDA